MTYNTDHMTESDHMTGHMTCDMMCRGWADVSYTPGYVGCLSSGWIQIFPPYTFCNGNVLLKISCHMTCYTGHMTHSGLLTELACCVNRHSVILNIYWKKKSLASYFGCW